MIQENRTSNLVERSRKISKKPKSRSLRPALDNISYASAPRQEQKINTSGITSDPIMSAIFEDTAATTLRDQMAAERGRPVAGSGADAATLMVSNNDPTELFGESAQNWAALAFSDSSKK